MDTIILSRFSLLKEASTNIKAQPDNKFELRRTLSSSVHHEIELKPSCSERFFDAVTRASQAQVTFWHRIESSSNISPILAGIGDTMICSRKAIDTIYGLEGFTSITAAALGLHENQSVEQIIDRATLTIYVCSAYRNTESGQSRYLGNERLTPIVCDASSNSNAVLGRVNTVPLLFAKLWPARQDASIILAPGNGADDGRQRERNSQKTSKDKARSEQFAMSNHKRSRQLPRGSDDDDDDGENSKQPNGRKSRGKGPRKQNEFACPFFKHNPQKYGGRGGCREYSHEHVGNLLRDHIGSKHLRDNDLDGTTWLRLKETNHLRGTARYKAMYAILFPDDQAGIQNPYFEEQQTSVSPLVMDHNLQNAEVALVAREQLQSINRLDDERVKREAQIRLNAEVELRQIQMDLDAQILQSKEAASVKERQIRLARDQQLEEIGREMNQRRQSIQIRLDSMLPGRYRDMSTETSTQHVETGVRTGPAINGNQSIAGNQRVVSEMGRVNPASTSSTLASNAQYFPGTGASNSLALDGSLLSMEAVEPGLSTTQAFVHQGSPFDLGFNDDESSTRLTPQLWPSNPSLPSNTSHQLTSHVCCECCGQDSPVWWCGVHNA